MQLIKTFLEGKKLAIKAFLRGKLIQALCTGNNIKAFLYCADKTIRKDR